MVAHLVEVVDLLCLVHLDGLALAGDLFVEGLDLRDKALHFLQIGTGLCVEDHLDLPRSRLGGVGLVVDHDESVAFLLEFVEGGSVGHAQEADHSFVVAELGDGHHVVEEVSQDAHSFLDVTLGALRGLFLWDGRDDLNWVQLAQILPEPHKITVPPADYPFHLKGLDSELQKGRSPYPEEASRYCLAVGTIYSHQYLPTSMWRVLPLNFSISLMHLMVLANYGSEKL